MGWKDKLIIFIMHTWGGKSFFQDVELRMAIVSMYIGGGET
jgi:hypothetical protein